MVFRNIILHKDYLLFCISLSLMSLYNTSHDNVNLKTQKNTMD
jgi:hypothetical protein